MPGVPPGGARCMFGCMDTQIIEPLFIETFRLATRQAGAVALHLRGKVRAETKGGGTAEAEALTAVDLAAQDVILHLVHDRLPGVAVDAEEDTGTLALFAGGDPADALVVVDPIDGTLNYIRGADDFAVMGALIRGGFFTAALIHLPVHGTTLWGVRGQGVFSSDASGSVSRRAASGAADRIFHTPRTPASWRRALAPHAAAVELCRCSAVDASAPASGRAKAAVAEGRADRRRAIGLFLCLEAGGAVRMGDRRWQGEDPEGLPADSGPTLAAETPALADVLLRAIVDADPTLSR